MIEIDVGEISDPILSPFGYHLILLVDKKGEKIHTKHILKTIKPGKEDKLSAQKKLKNIFCLRIRLGIVQKLRDGKIRIFLPPPCDARIFG